MGPTAKPRVLLVFYSYTQQALKGTDAMADTFQARGCDVTKARIEFTDKRFAARFEKFPLEHPYRDMFGLLPAQLRRATGEILIPDEVRDGHYDLVCIGSPTFANRLADQLPSATRTESA